MAKNHSESLIWRNFATLRATFTVVKNISIFAPKSTSDYEEAMLLIFGAKIQIF